MAHPRRVLILVDDMFFAAKIRGTARLLDVEVEFIKSLDHLHERISAVRPELMIVDLNANGFDPLEAIRMIKSHSEERPAPVIGFLSHVQVELKRAAIKEGCDYVLPRSAFTEKLPELLSGDLSSTPAARA